jgi:cytosine/adenosine deaminase-related metal-dependent hydrolase
MTATVIRNADWVVAWDRFEGRHVYLRGADVAFDGAAITHVGPGYAGPSDRVVDGRGRMVMPGFVDLHAHPSSEPLRKGITDESRSPGFFHSSLYEYLTVYTTDREGSIACLRAALAELLLSGVTTVVDIAVPFEGWLDELAASGLRAVAAPMYGDHSWFTRNGTRVEYRLDREGGRLAFEQAARLVELARQHPSGRLSGMLAPETPDTCSPELIRDSFDLARERAIPVQMHVAESVVEFQEVTRARGLTPVQYLDSLGVLGPGLTVGHAIFLDHHPWLHWSSRRDLPILAERGVSVAHCPTVFSRRGIAMHSFGAYKRAGINLGIGTDTFPHNFLEEMRTACILARTTAETVDDLTTTDVYDAATIGGAKAIARDDLGRLAVGAKADLVLVDLTHPAMIPLREPIRNLVYVAADRAVRDVYVDGVQVVAEGRVLSIDVPAALAALQEAQARMLAGVEARDWKGRTADEMVPLSLPLRDRLGGP